MDRDINRDKMGDKKEENKYRNNGENAIKWINKEDGSLQKFFEKSDWLTAKEAAVYLRKFRSDGVPSLGAIYMMLGRGQLRKRKFFGRLYFDRREIERALESANSF
jgi:hypothetical protein